MFFMLFSATVGFVGGAVASYYYLGKPDQKKRLFLTSAQSRKDNDGSHEDFLTGIVKQLWDYVNPAASKVIRESLEPTLADLDMSLTKVDLGATPLLIDHVVVHEVNHSNGGVIKFDMDLLWDGECEVSIKARVAQFGVKSFKLRGRLSFLLKPLVKELPCVGAVSFGFVNQPQVDLDFTGLAQVADLSVIQGTIHSTIHDALAGMVVLPHRMMTKLDPNTSLADMYQPPMGVVRITFVKGRDFPIENRGPLLKDDVPDVYCTATLGNATLLRTTTVPNSTSPEWKSGEATCDFVCYDYDQVLTIRAWDEDTGTLDHDDDLGATQVRVRDLLLRSKSDSREVALRNVDSDEPNGAFLTVDCHMIPLTADTAETAVEAPAKGKNQLQGLVTILVMDAKKIELPKADATTFVKVSVGDGKDAGEFFTGMVAPAPGVDNLNPVYNRIFDFPLLQESSLTNHDVTLSLMQQPPGTKAKKDAVVLGTTTVTRDELLNSSERQAWETRVLSGGSGTPELEFSVRLRGMATSETVETSGLRETTTDTTNSTSFAASAKPATVSKTSKIRLTVVSGEGFTVTKKFLSKDIPDIYCKVRIPSAGSGVWTTSTQKNTVSPKWDESKDFTVATAKEAMIQLDAYDANSGHMDSDDYVGQAQVKVSKLLLGGGTAKMELLVSSGSSSKRTGAYITVKGELL